MVFHSPASSPGAHCQTFFGGWFSGGVGEVFSVIVVGEKAASLRIRGSAEDLTMRNRTLLTSTGVKRSILLWPMAVPLQSSFQVSPVKPSRTYSWTRSPSRISSMVMMCSMRWECFKSSSRIVPLPEDSPRLLPKRRRTSAPNSLIRCTSSSPIRPSGWGATLRRDWAPRPTDW